MLMALPVEDYLSVLIHPAPAGLITLRLNGR